MSRGPVATPHFHPEPGRAFPACRPHCAARVCLEKKAGQFVFIQNHLRSHFGEMKGEKRASCARPAGCPLVPGGARVGGGAPPRRARRPGRPGSEGGGPQAGRRPRRPHLHEAHTRGPSAKAQLNAGGGGLPKLAFPRPSGARSGRGRTKGAGRGEWRVCRGIDLQMRLCQRVKAGRTPDPAPAPPAGPRPLAAQAREGTRRPGCRWACAGGGPGSFGALRRSGPVAPRFSGPGLGVLSHPSPYCSTSEPWLPCLPLEQDFLGGGAPFLESQLVGTDEWGRNTKN